MLSVKVYDTKLIKQTIIIETTALPKYLLKQD